MNAAGEPWTRAGRPGEDREEWPMRIEPSWWNYVGHLLLGWLLVPLAVAVWKQAGVRLLLFPDRVVLETGLIRKRVLDLAVSEIKTMEIRQSAWQRLCRIGDLRLATSGHELVVRGFPDPRGIAERIAQCRRRLAGA